MSHDKVIRTFDDWAHRGHDAGMEDGHGDVVRQVLEQVEVRPGEKVLDLGCGNGWATRLLAQKNAGVQAIGIDVSPKMIERAEELHSLTIRARYDHGNFEGLEFADDHFDRIFSMEAMYYAADLDRALAECFRVLKPDGVADVVVDCYAENPGSESWAEKMGLALHRLAEADWIAAFERAGFSDVSHSRVVDSRGPGEEAGFTPSEWSPSWEHHVAQHAAGSLWVRGKKPAG